MEIGKRIKSLREQRGMTQAELASHIKSTKQTIFKYESGIVTNIPMDKLITIANVLGCSPAYLLGWENSNNGINNGIIGNQNHNNVIFGPDHALGEIEAELLSLCKKMSMQQKAKLLTYAYEILDKKDY